MVLEHSFQGYAMDYLKKVRQEEREALFHLLNRECVAYTEAIDVYVNPGRRQGYRIDSQNLIVNTLGEHISSVSFHNCCRKIIAIPEEFRAMPLLRRIFYWQAPALCMVADIGNHPYLERLGVVGCPSVEVYCSEPHKRLKKLEVRESNAKEIPSLSQIAPKLEEVDFRDNRIENIESLDSLVYLEKADLRGNNIFPWLSPRTALANRRRVKELRKQGVKVLV